jgi:spore germination protein GerM
VKQYGLIAAIAFFVGVGSFLIFRDRMVESPAKRHGTVVASDASDASVARDVSVSKQTRFRVHLYFADAEQRYLKSEERNITVSSDRVVDKARAMIHALILGPDSSLVRTIPEQTSLLALHVSKEGIAYVDFDRHIVEGHPKGTSSEVLTIFSIVNTLALNLPGIEAVCILVEGQEKRTLAGHVEIRFPFEPNLLMIK